MKQPLPQPRQPLGCFLSLHLAILDISHKWKHAICILLWLAAFHIMRSRFVDRHWVVAIFRLGEQYC